MAKIAFITLYDKGCLGVKYMSSLLRGQGHDVSVIYVGRHGGKIKTKKDAFTSKGKLWVSVTEYGADIVRSYSDPIGEKDVGLLLDLLGRLQPDIVGFSLRSIFLDSAIELTRRIRQKFSFPIIYGGIAPLCEPEKCIEHADIICMGEGERSILEIANSLDKNQPLNNINNLWVRLGGTVHKNGLSPLCQNLDEFPFPDYAPDNKFWINNGKLVEHDTSIGNMTYAYEIITSRGCPFSCTYCCNDLFKRVYQGQKYLRRRSVDNVISELKKAKSGCNAKSILFRDEVFTFDWEWIREFSGRYKKEIGLPFWCNTHPSFVNANILGTLRKCGMFSVTMGIQSGSEDILYNTFNRRTPIKKIIEAGSILDKLNLPIRPRYDIITNNVFEKEEDRRKTLELLMSLSKPVNFGLSKLSFIPGTTIVKMHKEQNINKRADEKVYKFWNTLYLLNQYPFFPNRIIEGLSKNRFLSKHPGLLQPLLFIKFIEIKWQNAAERIKAALPKNLILFLKRLRYILKGY